MNDTLALDAATPPTSDIRPHACGGCPNRWTGTRTAHCGACHQTFAGITAFDTHRTGGHCTDPARVGLQDVGRAYPCWGNPGDTTQEN